MEAIKIKRKSGKLANGCQSTKMTLTAFLKLFSSFKGSLNRNEDIAYETLRFYTYVTRVLLDDLSDIIKTSNGSETWRNLVTYKNMLRGIESMAVEMSFGIIFIGRPSTS